MQGGVGNVGCIFSCEKVQMHERMEWGAKLVPQQGFKAVAETQLRRLYEYRVSKGRHAASSSLVSLRDCFNLSGLPLPLL